MQFRGCGTALVTPFRPDSSIDETALRNLVAWQVESGIDFLVPCGTTGETPTLSHDEWLRVIDITIEVGAGRVPIVAGATSNSTLDAVNKAKEVAARSGVNGVLTRLEPAAGITALAIKHQIAPPTINLDSADPACDLDYVPHKARPMRIRYALSNSFGFGGTNASVVLKRLDV